MSYIEKIAARIAGVTDEQLAKADSWVAQAHSTENTTVVGRASDESRRLFFLWSHNDREHDKFMHQLVGLKRFEEKPDTAELEVTVLQHQRDKNLFEILFWASVRNSYPELANKPVFGIGPDWQVYYGDEAESAEHGFFKALFEGIFGYRQEKAATVN